MAATEAEAPATPVVLVAAVALIDVDGRVLLAERPAGKDLAGMWEFPGGKVQEGETPEAALIRELEEELGIHLTAESVVGWLDDYATRSGYVMTPVVLWGGANPALKPARAEVEAVYRVTLKALVDAEPRFVSIPQSDRPVLQLPLRGDLIHAPTAAILFQLRQVGLLGRVGERVEGIEEPPFAWR